MKNRLGKIKPGHIIGYVYDSNDKESIDFGRQVLCVMHVDGAVGYLGDRESNVVAIDPSGDFRVMVGRIYGTYPIFSAWSYEVSPAPSFISQLLGSKKNSTLSTSSVKIISHSQAEKSPSRHKYVEEVDEKLLIDGINSISNEGSNVFVAIPSHNRSLAEALLRVLEKVGGSVGTSISEEQILKSKKQKNMLKTTGHLNGKFTDYPEYVKYPPTLLRALLPNVKLPRRFTRGASPFAMQTAKPKGISTFETPYVMAEQWYEKVREQKDYDLISPYRLLSLEETKEYYDKGVDFYSSRRAVISNFFEKRGNIVYPTLAALSAGVTATGGMSGIAEVYVPAGMIACLLLSQSFQVLTGRKILMVGNYVLPTTTDEQLQEKYGPNGHLLRHVNLTQLKALQGLENPQGIEAKDWTADWSEVFDRHSKIISQWLEYEMDLFLSLSYPLMVDSSVPETAALNRAVVKAGDLKKHVDMSINPVETNYYNAVQDLTLAFEVAENNARKTGQSIWDQGERKKIDTTRNLLSLANDEGASPQERAIAFKQALKTVEGIMVLPRKGQDKMAATIGLIEA